MKTDSVNVRSRLVRQLFRMGTRNFSTHGVKGAQLLELGGLELCGELGGSVQRHAIAPDTDTPGTPHEIRDHVRTRCIEMLSCFRTGSCVIGVFPRRYSLLGRMWLFAEEGVAMFGRSEVDAILLQAGMHAYRISTMGPLYLVLGWK